MHALMVLRHIPPPFRSVKSYPGLCGKRGAGRRGGRASSCKAEGDTTLTAITADLTMSGEAATLRMDIERPLHGYSNLQTREISLIDLLLRELPKVA